MGSGWISELCVDEPEISVVKATDPCAGGDLCFASGPVFDDSMVRAILVEGIVDSIVMVDKRRIRERVGVGAFHSTQ